MSRIPADAFDFYVSLGPERSYRAVAKKYGVSKRAITKFAAKEGWVGRLAKIESEAREKADSVLVENLSEMRTRHLRTLKAMNARVIEALKSYPLNSGIEGVRAAEAVIKLERLIAGEPSQRSELTIEEVTRNEIQSLLTKGEVGDDDEDDW